MEDKDWATYSEELCKSRVQHIARLTDLANQLAGKDHHQEAFEAIEQQIQEMPLSVQVRSEWYTPGQENVIPSEFEILLSTGGPATRIVGELDAWGQATNCRVQARDWWQPWTNGYTPTSWEQERLVSFCNSFYFADC